MAAVGPVLVWALAALAGARLAIDLVPASHLSVLAALAGLLAVAVGARRRARGWPAAVGAALVLFGLAGMQLDAASRGPVVELASRGGTLEARWKVVAEPRVSAYGWWTIARVTALDGRPTRTRVAWHGRDDPPVLGSRWAGPVSARLLPSDGFGDHLRAAHAAARIDPVTPELVGAPAPLTRASETVRARVRTAAARHLPPGPAGLAVGLVTGDTRGLPAEDQQAMRGAGLTHLVAVSGSNVALVVLATTGLAGVARLGARGRSALVLAAVLWFAFLTRFEPSVMRAATAALLVLAVRWRGTSHDARHVLGATVLVLLLVDPLLAGSLGLLLSASAAAGVLLLTPHVARRLRWLPTRVRALAAATLAAQMAVAPLLLLHDGTVPLAAVPANLVAVPAAAAASVAGILGSVLGLLSSGLGGAVFATGGPALRLVLAVARAAARAGPVVSMLRPVTVVAAAAVCLWLGARAGTRLARTGAVGAALAAAVLVAPGLPLPHAHPGGFTLTAIDVGQGDAILLEVPGTRVLVDGGPDDAAAAWLRGTGRRRLDLVVLSHPDADHLAGLDDVLAVASVGALWAHPVEGDERADGLLRRAAADGVPVHRPVAGQVWHAGELRLEVLHPPPDRPFAGSDREANEMSVVLRATWRGHRALLTGDVEERGQALLLHEPARLRAGLLKVPHHGSRTSTAAFLRAPAASVAVVSAGRGNRFGHPHPDVVSTLRAVGARIHRTDLDGTVTVAVPAHGSGVDTPDAGLPPSRSRPAVRSRHATARAAVPRRRRRRPPPAPQAGPAPRRPARRAPGAGRRGARRVRDRRSAGPAHGIAVRR